MTDAADFTIADHVPKKSDAPTVKWFDVSEDLGIPRGFEVKLCHVSKRTVERWARECTKQVRNPITKLKGPKLDEKALFGLFADNVVMDWKGLTVGGLKRLLVMKNVTADDSTPVPPTRGNKIMLLEQAEQFDVIVNDLCREPTNFLPGGPRESEDEEQEHEAEEAAQGN